MLPVALCVTMSALAVLILASNVMLGSAVEIARRYRISPLIVGSTIVAIGTGLPTIAVSTVILLTNPSMVDVAVGNVLGTTIVNLGLALGIPAFLTTIETKYSVYEKELPLYLAMMGLLTTCAIDKHISRIEGAAILGSYLIASYIIYQYAKRERSQGDHSEHSLIVASEKDSGQAKKSISSYIFRFVAAFLFLLLASFGISMFSGVLSRELGISEYVLGLTVVGIGTSLPTIITCVQAARKGYLDIVIGNVFGGNIVNIGLGIGIPAILSVIVLNAEEVGDIQFTNIYNMVIIVLVLLEMKLLGSNKVLSRLSGVVIVGLYLLYLARKLM